MEFDVFMRYVSARTLKMYRDDTYRIYLSEQLRLLPQGKSLRKSYHDIISDTKKEKKAKSGKEVAEEVAAKLGVKINWGR